MSELKSCPFCGSHAFLFIPDDIRMQKNGCFVECNNCGCRTAGDYPNADSKRVAIEAWNTRADGWISVDENHFEWSCVVAIPLANGEFYINMVSVGDEGDLFDMDGSYIGYHASEVTHWMQLPSAPARK